MENYKKEEWGAWKIVSDMLDNPNDGIYPTSKCYQKLYDFVCKQKEKAKQEERERILKALPKEKVGEPSWDGKSGTFGAFNEAIKQIKNIIKQL